MGRVTLVLGAGASRGVSYAHQGRIPSPLDGDFFDLLQRLEPSDRDEPAVKFVLHQCSTIADYELRRSMERAFYTLHLRAYLREKLLDDPKAEHETELLVGNFARAVQSLLRAAHGKRVCEHHKKLLAVLGGEDLVISFNYDLAVERAVRQRTGTHRQFGPWLYGFASTKTRGLPLLLKLHGSSNWLISKSERFVVQTDNWDDFDLQPGYRGHKGSGTVFPILLPFWDKRIEKRPWRRLWSHAAKKLVSTKFLIVWGYSLPLTDVKSRELFNLCLQNGGEGIKMCVIDPSHESRARWRNLLRNASYWEYDRILDFFAYPPTWWAELKQLKSKK